MNGLVCFYASALSFLCTSPQGLPAAATLVLEALAGGFAVPTGLALAALASWFEGRTVASRAANQRTVLRGLIAALVASGLAALAGLGMVSGVARPEWMGNDCPLPLGPPHPSVAAAMGFALAAAFWRRDWRWGLGYCLATGAWTGAQVCASLRYPLDIVAGTVIGIVPGWLIGSARWLDRPLNALIRLARRLMLA